MEVFLESLEKTGLLTTVGGPISLTVAIYKLLKGDKHDVYYLLPFIQVFIIATAYMAIFGWRIETSPVVTIILFCLSSIVASVCTVFVLRRFVPSHLYLEQVTVFEDINRGSLLRVIFFWVFGFSMGVLACVFKLLGEECSSPRCIGHEFVWGSKGYVGSFWIPTFIMCITNTLVLFAVFVAKRRRV